MNSSVLNTKGATLSENTALRLFKNLTSEDLMGLPCWHRSFHGHPYRLFVRHDVEAVANAKLPTKRPIDPKLVQAQQELSDITTNIKQQKNTLKALEAKKKELRATILQLTEHAAESHDLTSKQTKRQAPDVLDQPNDKKPKCDGKENAVIQASKAAGFGVRKTMPLNRYRDDEPLSEDE